MHVDARLAGLSKVSRTRNCAADSSSLSPSFPVESDRLGDFPLRLYLEAPVRRYFIRCILYLTRAQESRKESHGSARLSRSVMLKRSYTYAYKSPGSQTADVWSICMLTSGAGSPLSPLQRGDRCTRHPYALPGLRAALNNVRHAHWKRRCSHTHAPCTSDIPSLAPRRDEEPDPDARMGRRR
ncbi:hypothetical protein L227DRAFT_153215 [Lentinus tigrinus ALCF2SS1-6]|uniref:Uncharacterized protein n=1 Tax=Lentinus tigrinus ALCF2SS1-6 TaxID=1328759 RepID=A0A5C2SE63_9APHY|nr:hypothetical protein L227DRAFT_153215 [Lentinus tigrinus ALCF2SS1-6]